MQRMKRGGPFRSLLQSGAEQRGAKRQAMELPDGASMGGVGGILYRVGENVTGSSTLY